MVTTYTRATPNNLESSLLHRSVEEKSGSKDKAAYTPTRSYTKVEKRTTLESSSAIRGAQQHPGISSASRDRRERYGGPTTANNHNRGRQQQPLPEMSYSATKERSPHGAN